MVILQAGGSRNVANSLPSPARGSPSIQSLPNTDPELRGMEQMLQRWRGLEAQKTELLKRSEPIVKQREQKEYEELRRRFFRGKAEPKEQRTLNAAATTTKVSSNFATTPGVASVAGTSGTAGASAAVVSPISNTISSISSCITACNEDSNRATGKRKAASRGGAEPWPGFDFIGTEPKSDNFVRTSPIKKRVIKQQEPSPNNQFLNASLVGHPFQHQQQQNVYPPQQQPDARFASMQQHSANVTSSFDNRLAGNGFPADLMNIPDANFDAFFNLGGVVSDRIEPVSTDDVTDVLNQVTSSSSNPMRVQQQQHPHPYSNNGMIASYQQQPIVDRQQQQNNRSSYVPNMVVVPNGLQMTVKPSPATVGGFQPIDCKLEPQSPPNRAMPNHVISSPPSINNHQLLANHVTASTNQQQHCFNVSASVGSSASETLKAISQQKHQHQQQQYLPRSQQQQQFLCQGAATASFYQNDDADAYYRANGNQANVRFTNYEQSGVAQCLPDHVIDVPTLNAAQQGYGNVGNQQSINPMPYYPQQHHVGTVPNANNMSFQSSVVAGGGQQQASNLDYANRQRLYHQQQQQQPPTHHMQVNYRPMQQPPTVLSNTVQQYQQYGASDFAPNYVSQQQFLVQQQQASRQVYNNNANASSSFPYNVGAGMGNYN